MKSIEGLATAWVITSCHEEAGQLLASASASEALHKGIACEFVQGRAERRAARSAATQLPHTDFEVHCIRVYPLCPCMPTVRVSVDEQSHSCDRSIALLHGLSCGVFVCATSVGGCGGEPLVSAIASYI